MRIVIIQRDQGEYTDGKKTFDLIEVPNNSNLSTKKEVVNYSSAKEYAEYLCLKKIK